MNLGFVINGATSGRRPSSPVFTESAVNDIVESVLKHSAADGKSLPEAERRKLVSALYRATLMRVEERSADDEPGLAAHGA